MNRAVRKETDRDCNTSSLKYTYLHMILLTGAKIGQGLPERELVKKQLQTCQ